MQIDGPLKIEIAEPADGQGKILVIAFGLGSRRSKQRGRRSMKP